MGKGNARRTPVKLPKVQSEDERLRASMNDLGYPLQKGATADGLRAALGALVDLAASEELRRISAQDEWIEVEDLSYEQAQELLQMADELETRLDEIAMTDVETLLALVEGSRGLREQLRDLRYNLSEHRWDQLRELAAAGTRPVDDPVDLASILTGRLALPDELRLDDLLYFSTTGKVVLPSFALVIPRAAGHRGVSLRPRTLGQLKAARAQKAEFQAVDDAGERLEDARPSRTHLVVTRVPSRRRQRVGLDQVVCSRQQLARAVIEVLTP